MNPTHTATLHPDGTVHVTGPDGEQDLPAAGAADGRQQIVEHLTRAAQEGGGPLLASTTDSTGTHHLKVHPSGQIDVLTDPTTTPPPAPTPAPMEPAPSAPPAPTAAPAPTTDPDRDLVAAPTAAPPAPRRPAADEEEFGSWAVPAPSTEPTPAAPALGTTTTHADPATPDDQASPETRTSRRAAAQDRSFLARHQDADPAQTGLRGYLTRLGFRTGPSEAELAERAEVRAISGHWPGPRTIAIVNGKGGAGKTPTTVLLSALFARHGGAGVLAWDNNETRGTLGWRTEQGPHESHVLDLVPHTDGLMLPTARAADLAAFVHHQTDDKFDVLRSNPTMPPRQQRLTAADFDAVHLVASKYFRLLFIDSGNDETAPHWLRMIDHTTQLVVATTTRPDHAEAGRLLLDALRDRDPHSRALADGAIVVVSQADREDQEASAATIAAGYDGLARQAVTVPYDPALRTPWLRLNALHPKTRRAYLTAAAAVSDGL